MIDTAGSPPQRFSVLEIRRAIAHHRRAIQALHDQSAFQGIHAQTADQLIEKLELDLRRLEDELGRARMSGFADRRPHITVPIPSPAEDITLSPVPVR